jgi:hypothetical protein
MLPFLYVADACPTVLFIQYFSFLIVMTFLGTMNGKRAAARIPAFVSSSFFFALIP